MIFHSIAYPSIIEENIRKVRHSVEDLTVIYHKLSHNVSSTIDNAKCMCLYTTKILIFILLFVNSLYNF